MFRHIARLFGSCAFLALAFVACRDGATGPGMPRSVSLALAPRFQAGVETALPTNRIRIAAYRVLDAEGTQLEATPLASQEFAVSASDPTWEIALDVPVIGGAPVKVRATLELINAASATSRTVEWAGRTGIVTIVPGRDVTEQDLPLGRGPLPNLDVTAVGIDESPTELLVGDSTDLTATLEPELEGTTLYWGALDPAVATVTPEGRVRAVSAGNARITATSGFHADTLDVAIADPSSIVDYLEIVNGQDQQAAAGTAVPQPIRVTAFALGGAPVRGVTITFAVTGGGGTITGPTTLVTNANGTVQLGGWTLGNAAGQNTLSAVVAAKPATLVTIRATGTAGLAQNVVVVSGSGQTGTGGTALAQPLVARVRDQFNNPVANVRVDFATPNGGTFSAVADTSDAQGLVQTTWTPGRTVTAQTATATAAGVTTPATFTTTVTLPPPQVQLALLNADKVSLGRTQTLSITLPAAAPAGGTTVTVTSSAPSVLAVVGGNQATIAAGQTAATLQLSGLVEGNATLTATSPDFQTGTLATSVELRVIGVPTTINVPFGQTASLPINIARAAPAGGLVLTLTTSDASKVGLSATTVTIPAGSTTASVTLNGVNPGPSELVVSHPLYTPDTTAATTTAALDILNSSYNINTSFGATTPVRFLSNGAPVPAPAPGVAVNVVARNPACVLVPATLTIPTGLTEAALAITYNPQGGTTSFPCTTRVVVSSTAGIALDSANVTVAAQPGISVTSASVGAGLQRSWAVTLGASNHGGTTVTINSSDPQKLLLAPNASTAGSASIAVPLLNGQTQVNFYVQALDAATGPVPITAAASQFVDGAGTATIVTPALELIGVSSSLTSLSGNDEFYVRVGVANAGNQFLVDVQDRRFGGSPLVATATVSDPAVIQIATSSATGTSGTAQILGGQSNTPTSLASGGLAVKPIGNGTATVTATIPGVTTTSNNGSQTVTVTTPTMATGNVTVGAGLQRNASVNLGAPAPAGGVTVRIQSANPALVKVATSATSASADFIDVTVAAGNSSFTYYVHGMEGQAGQTTLAVSAPGYASASGTITVVPPALDVIGLSTTTTTLTGDDEFYVRSGIANANNQFLTEVQDVRTGGTPLVVTITSATPTVATLVKTAGVQGGTTTLTIPVGQSNTPTSVASGGVSLRPLGAGSTTVTASAPGAVTTNPNAIIPVTVSQPTQGVNPATVGAGLQRAMGGSLGASNHGGVTVRLTSADPARLLLATSATAAGASFIDIAVANGNNSYTYYIHGVEGQTGTVAVTAATPGFAGATANMTVVQPSLDIQSLSATTTTLTGNDEFYVRIGIANANNQFLTEVQDVRIGGVPVTVTLATSAPGVAQLVPSATNGTTATVTIPIGDSNSPTSVAAGGVSLDPLTAGTTSVVASSNQAGTTANGMVTVTVSAPAISISTGAVGSGLQRQGTISLGAPAPTGGLTVRLTSSQPSVMLLSPNATTAGAAFIDLVVAQGNTAVTFYAHGVDAQTGTPTIAATAPGFADGSVAQPVVAPALDIIGLSTSRLVSATNDEFYVRIGIANANNQFLTDEQDRRAGGTPLAVTVTNSNATVAQLVTSTSTGQSVALQIAAGQSNTPTTVATGGVAFDPLAVGSTRVSATIPGFATTNPNGQIDVTVTASAIRAAVAGATR